MKEVNKKDQAETYRNEAIKEIQKVNEIEGLEDKKLIQQAKIQVFKFQRFLEEKELERIREYLYRIQKNANFLEKAKEKADKREFVKLEDRIKASKEIEKDMKALKEYLAKQKLEVKVEEKLKPEEKILFQKPKRAVLTQNKELGSQSLTMCADGDMGDQQDEYLVIEGRMSRADIERIKSYQAELREIDQRMDINEINPSDASLEAKEGLQKDYMRCVNNMTAYINTHVKGATIRATPKKTMEKEIQKAQQNKEKLDKQIEKKKDKTQEKSRSIGARKQEY